MRGSHTLTDTRLLQEKLKDWLYEQRDIRARTILDGSAADYAEYRERCGYLAALSDMNNALSGVTKDINGELEGER